MPIKPSWTGTKIALPRLQQIDVNPIVADGINQSPPNHDFFSQSQEMVTFSVRSRSHAGWRFSSRIIKKNLSFWRFLNEQPIVYIKQIDDFQKMSFYFLKIKTFRREKSVWDILVSDTRSLSLRVVMELRRSSLTSAHLREDLGYLQSETFPDGKVFCYQSFSNWICFFFEKRGWTNIQPLR